MKSIFTLACLLFSFTLLFAQTKDPKDTEVWEPEPRVVTPGVGTAPPSDAIVLLGDSSLDHWESANEGNGSVQWEMEDGVLTVVKGTGGIQTKENFGDVQLHIEWRSPTVIEGEGQGRGNSGVFFQKRYEVQVLDSYNNRTYSNGQAGAVYKQHIPLVNVCRKTGGWNTYDIIFTAPRFNADGIRVAAGRLTVFHNGVLIQNNVEILGSVQYIGLPKNIAHGDDKIMLQDHGNPVSFRNIWLRKL